MSKKVFISFNFKELGYLNDVRNLFAGYGGRVEATPVHVENDVSAEGVPAIQKEIQRIMAPCRGLIVVVGDVAHNSPWISYELSYADSQQIPKVAVKHPNATGGLPNLHTGMKVVGWNSQELVDIVGSWK